MSVNFNLYGDQAIGVKRMNIADLEVGQTLIRLFRPRNHWGVNLGEFRTAEYTVKKVLKTRLVLEPTDNPSNELRLLVDQKKWSIRCGDVTTDREGNSQSYSRDSYEFATADETELIESIRKHYADAKAELEERNALKTAIAEVRHELDGNADLAKIDAAIEALTKLRERMTSAE